MTLDPYLKATLAGFALTGVLKAAPPPAPTGFQWKPNTALTDEFNGDQFDASKWNDHIPAWKGRPPGKFTPSSISLEDGCLRISCAPLDPPDDPFTIATGAIQSKNPDAHYGYYECRMKASNLTTSSNIWMVGGPFDLPTGKLNVELIVQFTVGASEELGHLMKSNAMTALKPPGKDKKKEKAKKTNQAKLKSGVADEFHTYGCWWVDESTIHFYADGEHVYTINPSARFEDKPFRHPLFFTLVCETFDWMPIPTKEELEDPSRNTAYFDYVRSYTLEKKDD